jgi:hypothetical protein
MSTTQDITSAGGTNVPAVGTIVKGDEISADTFLKMVRILEDLAGHQHIFYDDYNTVCECQCQCQCGRGVA